MQFLRKIFNWHKPREEVKNFDDQTIKTEDKVNVEELVTKHQMFDSKSHIYLGILVGNVAIASGIFLKYVTKNNKNNT